jgi:hypothetical protein
MELLRTYKRMDLMAYLCILILWVWTYTPLAASSSEPTGDVLLLPVVLKRKIVFM